jgi:hypothetical protein
MALASEGKQIVSHRDVILVTGSRRRLAGRMGAVSAPLTPGGGTPPLRPPGRRRYEGPRP